MYERKDKERMTFAGHDAGCRAIKRWDLDNFPLSPEPTYIVHAYKTTTAAEMQAQSQAMPCHAEQFQRRGLLVVTCLGWRWSANPDLVTDERLHPSGSQFTFFLFLSFFFSLLHCTNTTEYTIVHGDSLVKRRERMDGRQVALYKLT